MASAKLSRTTTTPTSADIGTVSFWMKRSVLDENNNYIISNYTDGSNYGYIRFKSDNQLQVFGNQSQDEKRTNRLFRDVNAWYHIVLRVDTTQGTAGDRVRMYINGVQETSFTTSTDVGQNTDYDLFKSGGTMIIGHIQSGTATYFSGQLAHFHYVDGQSYAPTVFGETDATTGIWKPKTDPGISQANYGNNGFFLKFDNSANMGLDSSGNSHNLTTSGTIIQNKDTPSNVFNTLSPIDIPTNSSGSSGTLPTLSNANTSITNSNSAFREVRSNFYVTKGKYYFEAKPTRIGGSGAFQVGVALNNYSQGSGERRAYQNNGYKYISGSSSYGATFTANDIIGVALNLTDGEITFYKNGVSQGVAATDMLSGIDSTGWTAVVNCYDADGHLNFGNGYFGTTAVSSAQNPDDGIGIFEYSVPTGYKALCTKSLNAQEYS
jgi:hypothetical protein